MKKRIISLVLVVALCVVFVPFSVSASAEEFTWVIEPQFGWAQYFSEGLAAVSVGDLRDGPWGFIDRNGDWVIEPQFTFADSFSDGTALVGIGDMETGRLGRIDTNGNWVERPFAFAPRVFCCEGLSPSMSGDYWGFIDENHDWVIEPQFGWVEYFSEGLAAVRVGDLRDGLWGFIDRNGDWVVEPKFTWVESFYSGLSAVSVGDRLDGPWGLIDRNGDWVVEPQFSALREFHYGLAAVSTDDWLLGPWWFIDTNGDMVLGPFGAAWDFSEGLAAVAYNWYWGFIDTSGNWVIEPQFGWAQNFSEGLAAVDVNALGYEYPLWGFISLGTDSQTPQAQNQLDGASDWARAELESALSNDLILADMIENWTMPINRLMAAEAMARLIESVTGMSLDEIATENDFDMTDTFSDTHNRAVTFLRAAGISTGVDGVRYDPTGTFTRAQMVTMLGRMAENLFDVDISEFPLGSEEFSDIPTWADRYVGWAVAVGITDGVGSGRFDSNGVLQNQHMGIFAYRAYGVLGLLVN